MLRKGYVDRFTGQLHLWTEQEIEYFKRINQSALEKYDRIPWLDEPPAEKEVLEWDKSTTA